MPQLPLHLVLSMLLTFLAQGVSAQLGDVELKGSNKLSLSLKGAVGAKIAGESTGSLDVAANGDTSYDGVLAFAGRVMSTGNKSVLMLDAGDVAGLEGSIADAIDAAGLGITVNSVDIDEDKLKTKLAAKQKDRDITAKLGLAASFIAQTTGGEVSGKLKLGASVSNIPLCTVCGATYTGVEKFKQSLKGCGSLSGEGNASLAVAADDDEDGDATFTYTDSDGVDVTGMLVQDGKKFSCSLDASGMQKLEDAFEDIILDECGVSATVTITGEKCSGKPGKTGGASFAFGVDFNATDGPQSATGKSATKGVLNPLP